MDLSALPLPPPQSYRLCAFEGQRAGQAVQGQDCVAEEVPVAIEFNGVSHAVMMATPTDLEDFGYGFALTEGIVASLAQIHDCEITRGERGGTEGADHSATEVASQGTIERTSEGHFAGYTVQLRIAESCFAALKQRRRNLTGRTGCGLCGTESLEQAIRRPPPLPAPGPSFTAAAVARAMAGLRQQQRLLAATGASHAAAWCSADGNIQLLREDVGRHNALDKVIGALARGRQPAQQGFAVITSRASYEMVQKTAVAGIPLLAAVSGVTALAVELAEACGLTLLGFARGDDMSIYSHPTRLIRNPP